jgi:hypothetical protein
MQRSYSLSSREMRSSEGRRRYVRVMAELARQQGPQGSLLDSALGPCKSAGLTAASCGGSPSKDLADEQQEFRTQES